MTWRAELGGRGEGPPASPGSFPPALAGGASLCLCVCVCSVHRRACECECPACAPVHARACLSAHPHVCSLCACACACLSVRVLRTLLTQCWCRAGCTASQAVASPQLHKHWSQLPPQAGWSSRRAPRLVERDVRGQGVCLAAAWSPPCLERPVTCLVRLGSAWSLSPPHFTHLARGWISEVSLRWRE